MKMLQICTKWVRHKGSVEVSRKVVEVKKEGRWLVVGSLSFDQKGRQTKASGSGTGYRYRLEPLKTEEDELATTCFHCGAPAMPETRGFDPRCERHRDV